MSQIVVNWSVTSPLPEKKNLKKLAISVKRMLTTSLTSTTLFQAENQPCVMSVASYNEDFERE